MSKFIAYSNVDGKFELSTFENWEFTKDNEKLYTLGQAFCNKFLSGQTIEGLLINGDPGVGKSYFAYAVVNEMYKNNRTAIAISVENLLGMIKETFNSSGKVGEMSIINTLREASLIVLDDLGVEVKTEWSTKTLYKVIEAINSANKKLIITTNMTTEQLKQHLLSSDGVARTFNRIQEMCVPMTVKGDSWRTKGVRERKTNFFKDLGVI
ncbi:ATP-binding protein [Vallitalea okinawensis]|uniref:ATP-binding protein n=1 Tax=Vallitalea okinawensis TaxID=2078660 RepID=UPI000CFC1D2B|nr:ATP-binding protein [Vallitalea okinawensis]